jgi:hypothetical protein
MNHGGVAIENFYERNRNGALRYHIDAIKKRYDWIDKLKKELDSNDFLLIDFEGLVKNYIEYRFIIENFIGNIKYNHKKHKKYFDPMNAVKNIGIFRESLDRIEIRSLDDLEIRYKEMLKNNQQAWEFLKSTMLKYN